mgnify:CR=1 FL=1
MLQAIQTELGRLNATDTFVALDRTFEPEAGELVAVDIGEASWHMLPGVFLALLREMPDNAGSEAIQTAIEKDAILVWHDPSPKGSRDTSP